MYFSTIYGACEKTVAYLTETTPVKSHRINYTYPVEDQWLIDEFRRVVKDVQEREFSVYEEGDKVVKKGKVKLAIFDTVVSMPGVRFPYEQMTKVCKELGILSVVDGAHGVGHLDLNFNDGSFEPDFWVSNCHKCVFMVSRQILTSNLPTFE